MQLSPLTPSDHAEAAALIHSSLVHWYETRLGQGARFGESAGPFLLFPQVYEALDAGEAVTARDVATGTLLGVCFIHPRETHVSVGIVATAPEAAGRGVARRMMQHAVDLAAAKGQPLRLVSSLLNLDSFSLYTRMGFVPYAMYQDVLFTVPGDGLRGTPPPQLAQVRQARSGDVARMADLERKLQGIRRKKDLHFFLRNDVGSWKTWVMEDAASGELTGFMVASFHAAFRMTGPGVAQDEATAAALLWTALDAQRGDTTVLLAPCAAAGLVRTLYAWGGRNVELHAAQVLGPVPASQGLAFPTFLPETA